MSLENRIYPLNQTIGSNSGHKNLTQDPQVKANNTHHGGGRTHEAISLNERLLVINDYWWNESVIFLSDAGTEKLPLLQQMAQSRNSVWAAIHRKKTW